ncbi:MAG: carbamate kinase [Thaumarchaeota archaeon]|nr:carbamate kinase [Nitrososphaerota archaeon]
MAIAAVALGGNALIHPKERGTAEKQISRVNNTIALLKPLSERFSLVLTHGNGPQVGNLLLQQETAKDIVPPMPLDTLDAMTQGQLGYWIQQAVENVLRKNAATIITRVLVDEKDPAFEKPTKPIGPYYREKVFSNMVKEPEGWRRVVPSPKPVEIIDIEEIASLVGRGFVVIACGGGGIPVAKEKDDFIGIEAVVDKDYSTAKLASQLKADLLVFLTDVPTVYRNYGKRNQNPLYRLNRRDAQALLDAGEFKEGSMKPKIEASISFLVEGGKQVIITTVEQIGDALKGSAGTIIE